MRSKEIAHYGYRVIRFWNGDVMENLQGVLETISRELGFTLSAPGDGEGQSR
jgi:very-short-patch-repair endonuclease